MALPTTRNKGSFGHSSSPLILIKGQKEARPDSTNPKDAVTSMNQKLGQQGVGGYLPTPGPALPEKAQRKRSRLAEIEQLISSSASKQ